MRLIFVLFVLFAPGPAAAQGWHDYELPIAPGFSIHRNNSFEICLGESDGLILICPNDKGPVGPIAAYAVNDTAILTKHFGVTRNKKNPSILEGDPEKEFFFLTNRMDKRITGPLSRADWEQRGLPSLSAVTWVEPRNPNFWLPLSGDLMILGFVLLFEGWPVALVALAAILIWLYVRRQRRRHAA